MVKDPIVFILQEVGRQLRQKRIASNLNVEDLIAITGLSRSTIERIEEGKDCRQSSVVNYAMGLEYPLAELYNILVNFKPLYPMPATREEKTRLTIRIRELLDSGFFKEQRNSTTVSNEINERYGISTKAKDVGNILKRLVDEGYLKVSKDGRINHFKTLKRLKN